MRRRRRRKLNEVHSAKHMEKKWGGLPPEPCDRNHNKLIHYQFIYSRWQRNFRCMELECSSGLPQKDTNEPWPNAIQFTAPHRLSHINFNITFLSKSRVPASVYAWRISYAILYTVVHNLHSQSQKQNLTVFHSALLSLLLRMFDATAVLEGTVKQI
jgi:hypothetical protein